MGNSRDVGVAVPAAGAGRRMGGRRKPYLDLGGEPVLLHALRPFLRREDVRAVAVALPPDDADDPPGWLTGVDGRLRFVAGGESRAASVRAAIRALPPEVELVAIHDAARPLLADDVVARCIEVARSGRGAVAGWPAVDTIKEVDDEERIVRTPDRSTLWHAQTPQVFPRAWIVEAYRGAGDAGVGATDDAALLEARGREVRMVRGSRWNLKLTRPEDLTVARALLGDGGPAGAEAGRRATIEESGGR